MTTKKKVLYTLLALLFISIAYAANYAYRYALIGAGYNAKTVCSCVFVSGRSLASVEAEDLYAIPFGTRSIDTVAQTATATILGIASKTAVYRPKLGCTLLNDVTAEELRQQPAEEIGEYGPEASADSVLPPKQQEVLNKTLDWAFAEPDPKHPIRTRAVVVMHNGKVVAERYAKGITPTTALMGWSMTKSVTNAMIGLLVKDGKLEVNKPAPLAEWQNDNRRGITVDHLLRMSSGLKFGEVYNGISDATKMLFSVAAAGQYAIQSPAEVSPATKWYYSSGTSNILQELIRRRCKNHAEYLNFPHRRLFRTLGMSTAVLEPDASGTFVGSSFMYASARDWAKFGQLYAQDGVWKGERLLPEGWVNYSSRETPPSDGRYAAHFWTYVRKEGLPADSFTMNGFEGQFVLIIPSKQLVAVRLGCSPEEKYFNEVKFFKEIAAAF
ncbi:serine hydrolase domain-containing protein [Runella slithyformis]|uniref:Beta-lactamase n=1 Tax=Runella slithyformis (strain ATCC 29530 / DSM 19594 / LMG 11500 / NCIMB 11436 / LSU 4) TaxID=761193 RepID=A0A7U3ZGV8_RUNSL|nr:serine hydrolase [Runella slithyformis]AEI46992.1 beta-lactamase [Runella slithyformis DSM 19594]